MQVIKVWIALVMALVVFQAQAQVQEARGKVSVNYRDQIGTFDKKEVPAKVKQQAQQEAMLKAVEAYFAEAGQAEAANFDGIRSKCYVRR